MKTTIEKLVADLQSYGDSVEAEVKRLRAENTALRRAAKPAPKKSKAKGGARART